MNNMINNKIISKEKVKIFFKEILLLKKSNDTFHEDDGRQSKAQRQYRESKESKESVFF
jgi:hypothetical protein